MDFLNKTYVSLSEWFKTHWCIALLFVFAFTWGTSTMYHSCIPAKRYTVATLVNVINNKSYKRVYTYTVNGEEYRTEEHSSLSARNNYCIGCILEPGQRYIAAFAPGRPDIVKVYGNHLIVSSADTLQIPADGWAEFPVFIKVKEIPPLR